MGPSPGSNRGPRAIMLWVNALSANHTEELLVERTNCVELESFLPTRPPGQLILKLLILA